MEEAGVSLFCICYRLRHAFVECLLNVSSSFWSSGPEKVAFAANTHSSLKNESHRSVNSRAQGSQPLEGAGGGPHLHPKLLLRATNRGEGRDFLRGLNLDQLLIHEDISVW